jgi:hypothetical protein
MEVLASFAPSSSCLAAAAAGDFSASFLALFYPALPLLHGAAKTKKQIFSAGRAVGKDGLGGHGAGHAAPIHRVLHGRGEKTIDETVISFMQNLSSLGEASGQSWGTSSPAPVSPERPAPCF